MLLADQVVKSLALSRLLEGTFQRFDLRSALFMATLLVHKHELPINRGQLGFECLVVTGDEKLRGHQVDVFERHNERVPINDLRCVGLD